MIKILLILPLLLIFFCSTCYTYKYFCPADYTQCVLYKFNFIEYVLKIPKKTSWNTFESLFIYDKKLYS